MTMMICGLRLRVALRCHRVQLQGQQCRAVRAGNFSSGANRMMKTLAISIAFSLSACGSAAQSSHPRTASNDDTASNCQRMVDLAQLCYDNSNPDMSCGDMYQVINTASEKVDLRPSERDALATFCGNMCRARKRGLTWSDLSRAMRSNCQ